MQDGVDIIAWIAKQPWCDGNVGMFGKSWGAYNSFQVAAKRPPALKVTQALLAHDDYYAYREELLDFLEAYEGGASPGEDVLAAISEKRAARLARRGGEPPPALAVDGRGG